MKLEMIYKDQGSGGNGCPSIYLAEDGRLVVQGDSLDGETSAQLANVLPGETAVVITSEVLFGAVDRLRAKSGEL
jgi:hypothetical protein